MAKRGIRPNSRGLFFTRVDDIDSKNLVLKKAVG